MDNTIQTSFTDWRSGLRHFGVKGMKHGQRRFQNPDGSLTALGRQHYGVGGERSARGVSRDLRRMEKERAGAQARADYYRNRSEKYIAKAKLKVQKTGQPMKLSKKRERFAEKSKQYQKLANASKAMSDKVIKSALSRGMSINSRDTMRFVRKGKDKGLMLLGRRGTSVNSIKYHVHNDGLGVRRHKKSVGMINRSRHRSNW